jgi:hypothetical protein
MKNRYKILIDQIDTLLTKEGHERHEFSNGTINFGIDEDCIRADISLQKDLIIMLDQLTATTYAIEYCDLSTPQQAIEWVFEKLFK